MKKIAMLGWICGLVSGTVWLILVMKSFATISIRLKLKN
jgi:hypothetical protein